MEKLGFREEASEPNEGYQSSEAHPEHICRGESDHRLTRATKVLSSSL